MKSKILIILAIMLSAATIMKAQQPVVVEAAMDSSVLWMGEQTLIHLSLTQDAGVTVIPPQIESPGFLTEGVEVVDLSQPDTTRLNNNRLQIKQEVLVTSFDSGFYYIPPSFQIHYHDIECSYSIFHRLTMRLNRCGFASV